MAFDHTQDPGWQYLRMSEDSRMADQSKPFDSKKDCFIPDPEDGFIRASIEKTEGDMVTVQCSKGQKKVKADQIQEMNPPKFEKIEDMSNLSFLNDASVFYNLQQRYQNMLIYTYSGLFCVVINPYKRLPIYTESVSKIFMGKRKNEVPPHLWGVSDNAYRNMLSDRENQSMLITGESGAGKTENTKKVIAYFALVGSSQAAAPSPDEKKKVSLEDQIVQTNPVLEAFGNAKTVRNNNSSRFGKFIRIHFSGSGKVASCDIEHYLLEKSRVVRQAPGERCYHVFYQIMTGQIPGLKEKLRLTEDITYYHSVSQAELTVAGIDDNEECQMLDDAFTILCFSDEEKFNCYKIMSGLMHMGEMKFKAKSNKDDQAVPDGDDDAKNCAAMYGVISDNFLKAVVSPRVKVGTEWVHKGQTVQQVMWGLGAMAKGVYDRVFDWLVAKCNETLNQVEIQRQYFIGVLDIAGFEIFDMNSFEQLWINYVNEKLQQFFNHHMFVLEQEEYKREGINWVFIDFGLDLAACLELIEKPMGILAMLDEECIVPKATDLTLAAKLVDQHGGKTPHPSFSKPKPPKGKQSEAHFVMAHYAGMVRYNVINWLEKNKDPLNDTCVSVMKASTDNELLPLLWHNYTTQEELAKQPKDAGGGGKKKGKSAAMNSVSMKYREGLNNLMSMLNATHPHFVRCLIPNELKKSGVLDAGLVMNQLTCNGVLEGIRICRKGFPNRTLHMDFRQRYSILAADAAKTIDDPKDCSEAMMAKIVGEGGLTAEEFRIGHTKVFFKAGVLAKMEDLRDDALTKIMLGLQSQIRSFVGKTQRERLKEQIAGMSVIQSNIQAWGLLRTWPWFKLIGAVKPLLQAGKAQEEMDALSAIVKELEEKLAHEETVRKEQEELQAQLEADKAKAKEELAAQKALAGDTGEKIEKLTEVKAELEKSLADANSRVGGAEDETASLQRSKKKLQDEAEEVKRNLQDLELSLRKTDSEKQGKDNQLRSLQEEMQQQDEVIGKVNKEKKHQEEVNKKITLDLQAEEDKVNHLNKVKAKLEQTLDELEDSLEREKRVRQDTDKAKRKVEGELRLTIENLDEVTRQKLDADNNLKKKEQDLNALATKLEDKGSNVAKLQRQVKELQNKTAEMEEELEVERNSRAKSDRSRSELQREMEELVERLDEAGGATAAQIEVSKKREAELARLRRQVEEANVGHENNLANLRKKHNDSIAELGDQLDQLAKQRAKLEKERGGLQRDLEDIHAAHDSESKAKQNAEKMCKTMEVQLSELQSKVDEQARQLQDLSGVKSRLQAENGDLARQLEDGESQLSALHRIKSQLASQLEEAKRAADEEARERTSLSAQVRNFQNECDSLRDTIDVEAEGKAEVQRHLSKANAEIQQWKARFEGEGLRKAEELEDARRKLMQKVSEMQEQVDSGSAKIAGLEKHRSKLIGDLDDAQVDVERANTFAAQLEKKQKGFDRIVDDWRRKCDDLAAELDAAQRDARNLSTECFKLKNQNEEMNEQLEGLRRENRNLSQEIKDLTDQLGEGGRSIHEMQKAVRRLEVEKEELQAALDEAEGALEAEESKVLRAQVEVSQIRSEIEKRIQEKEEEFENTRKNHQRAIDSMQASLETEARGRAELLRVKKKLESDINELEIALDHANKANADAQKNIKRFLEQIKELQMQVEDEQRQRDEARESFHNAERRCASLQADKEELRHALDGAERARKQAEFDAHEARDQANEATAQLGGLSAAKRKLDAELQALHADVEETLNELKNSEERGKKAMADAARLAEELRQEQEHSMHVESMRKGLEATLKDMQARLDEAEAAALKGGRKVIAKLETRVRELEAELDGEQRRHQEVGKNLGKADRRVRELIFQIDEDKKNQDRLSELCDKLQQKIKVYKRQVEEAEELANANLQKYRQLQHQLEDAEERADMAENSLSKLRSKNRSSVSMSASGLQISMSSSVLRSTSGVRTSASAMNFGY